MACGNAKALPAAAGEANVCRDVRLDRCVVRFPEAVAAGLWQTGRGLFVSLFGIVIWVGLLISWLSFAGSKPPPAS